MTRARKLISTIMVLALILGLVPAAIGEAAPVTITILETSDLHGSIASYDYAIDAPTSGTGLARVATVVNIEREKDPELLLLDCGDSIQGNMMLLFNGDVVHPMINAMNFVGYDAWALGNHEFNYDFEMLERAISFFDGDVLIANAYNPDGERWQKPYAIYDVKDVKIGVFGINAPHIPRWEASVPERFNGMSFATPMEETGKMVEELRDQVDVLIGLIHYGRVGEHGAEGINEVSDKYPEVDAFFIGHAHEAFAEIRENGAAMLEPGINGSNVSKLTITLEMKDGKYVVTDKVPELILTADFEEDAQLLKAMRYVHDALVKEANTVVGYIAADFLPSLEWNDIPGIPTAQVMDTALIDLINEVQMYYTGADVSLAALFNFDSNLTEGPYMKKDAVNVYKYDNTLVAAVVTGAQLKAIMELHAGRYFNQYTPGDVTISFNPEMRLYHYDMFAGVNYDIDISKPIGERIVNLMYEGKPLNDDDEVVLALNNFRYGGLVGAGLIDPDKVVFNSSIDMPDTPAVRDLISVYVQEKGELFPVCDYNWAIVGYDFSDPDAEAIYQLLRDGVIAIPSSEDGRTLNVVSVNADAVRAQGLLDEAA